MSNDEHELIARILDGSTQEYATLVDRYKNHIYRHCFYIMHDEDAAEDMAQETFIRAYAKLAMFDIQRGNFRAWALTIATRQCLGQLRKTHSLPLFENDQTEDTSMNASPPQQAEAAELRQAVLKLRPKYRTAISLHYWQGYSYEEIAHYMNAPVGSVRGWLHRAKKQLKEALS